MSAVRTMTIHEAIKVQMLKDFYGAALRQRDWLLAQYWWKMGYWQYVGALPGVSPHNMPAYKRWNR